MANCNRQQLNITCGTDVVLHDRLIFEGETFDPNLSVGIAANLVSSLGKRTALDVQVVDDELLISVPWIEGTLPGCYGLEVTGSCNSKKWATYADSLIKYTKATRIGVSEVTVESDSYDITQEVGYCYSNSPVTFAEVTVDGGYGTPSVDVEYEQRVLSMAFHNLKGEPGEKGDQGPQGDSVLVGQGDLPLAHVLGEDATKAISQKGATENFALFVIAYSNSEENFLNDDNFNRAHGNILMVAKQSGKYLIKVHLNDGYVISQTGSTSPKACLGIRHYGTRTTLTLIDGYDYGKEWLPKVTAPVEPQILSDDISVNFDMLEGDEVVILDRITGSYSVTIELIGSVAEGFKKINGYEEKVNAIFNFKNAEHFNKANGTLIYGNLQPGEYRLKYAFNDGYSVSPSLPSRYKVFGLRLYDDNGLVQIFKDCCNNIEMNEDPRYTYPLEDSGVIYFTATGVCDLYMLDKMIGSINIKLGKVEDSDTLGVSEDKLVAQKEEAEGKEAILSDGLQDACIGNYPNLLSGTKYKEVTGLYDFTTEPYYSHAGQGHDIYNWYLFKLFDGGYCRIHDISKKEPVYINDFKLGNNSHCNNAKFSKVFPEGYDFPYLYIMGTDNTNTMYVEKINLEGSTLVQTIVFDFEDSGNHGMILGDDGYLYGWKRDGNSSPYVLTYYKFPCPPVTEGEVHIALSEAVAEYTFDYPIPTGAVGQGIMVHAGKIFKLHSNVNKPQFIDVYDMFAEEFTRIDLEPIPNIKTHELEDMCVWQDRLILTAEKACKSYWMIKF